MAEVPKFKPTGIRGGARPNSGPRPYRSAARGDSTAEFLRAVVADVGAPLADRLKAAALLDKIDARVAQEREAAHIRSFNSAELKKAGL